MHKLTPDELKFMFTVMGSGIVFYLFWFIFDKINNRHKHNFSQYTIIASCDLFIIQSRQCKDCGYSQVKKKMIKQYSK